MAESFRNRAVLITGASQGIGRELALQLASEGARLVLASRNSGPLDEVTRECIARGAEAVAVPADLAEQAACRELVSAAVKAFGPLDMVINNAGVSMYAPFASVRDPAMVERIARVNYLGPMYLTWYALPHLRQTRGRIVAVASLAAKFPGPGGTGYVASKWAMAGFFESLRTELRGDGVSVTTAYPGFVRTGIYTRFLNGEGVPGPDMTARVPRLAMISVERCAARVLAAARRRRRSAMPTVMERMILAVNRLAPRLVEFFWQRTLARDFPPAAEARG
ncbi:MAG: SDR family oxidoreductase [Gemmataceae bacterium]